MRSRAADLYIPHHWRNNTMVRIVLIFGLISGAIAAGLMWILIAVQNGGSVNLENGMVFGYATMIIALSLVFFGVKSYRDNNGGHITFLKGLQVGILISIICGVCYAASWELYYRGSGQEFLQKYTAHNLDKMKQDGSVRRRDREGTCRRREIYGDLPEFLRPFRIYVDGDPARRHYCIAHKRGPAAKTRASAGGAGLRTIKGS